MQVFNAPFILQILAQHIQRQHCSREQFMLITASISRITYTPNHGSKVPSNLHVQDIIAVATSDVSPLPEEAKFKLKALFAATGTAAYNHQEDLRTSGAAAALARWPGGRHDNDHVDFRAVQVVPSVAELRDESPFLPSSDGSDQFLVWLVSDSSALSCGKFLCNDVRCDCVCMGSCMLNQFQ